MQIEMVIKIPESILDTIQADEMISREQLAVLQMHILKGTPLPKGHGDLIDRSELLKEPMDTANYPSNYVRIAKAIIEADKEQEDGK